MRCAGAGAEHAQTALFKEVNDAGHQRRFRPDDGQAHVVGSGEVCQALEVHHVDIDVFQARLACGTSVSRSHKDAVCVRGLGGFPGESMFTTAGANY